VAGLPGNATEADERGLADGYRQHYRRECGSHGCLGGGGGYARPELLAETDRLAQHLNDPGIRIVDMRSEGAYQKGHILGAVHLGWKARKDADNELYVIPAEKLAGLMGQQGISTDTTVVAYDDQGGLGPARFW
jgi:3-mercaptopyruvate sulfurtransferase SseA